jgi:K+-dependent Na+/Ca+ exchanger-like protein
MLFACGLVLTVLRPWGGEGQAVEVLGKTGLTKFQLEEALKKLPQEEAAQLLARISGNSHTDSVARRLHTTGMCNIADCANPNITTPACCVQIYSAPHLCGGECVTLAAFKEAEALDSAVIFIDSENLKDGRSDLEKSPASPIGIKPVLKYTGFKFVIYFAMYTFGILYMFVALAIVCDEFFVPALECFVDEFGISMDVAGATFMAAGGSMPELFTSFIATFDETDVGFAAIVGSAVFNVLFVIAVCALASTETLTLTWWPLARDCTCYLVTLLTVFLFFKTGQDNCRECGCGCDDPDSPVRAEIHFYEALILLAEYGGYCALMKYNQKIQMWVKSKISKDSKVSPEGGSSSVLLPSGSKEMVDPHFLKPSTFRKGIVHLLTQNAYLYETAGIAAVTLVAGNLEDTFKSLDKNSDGELTQDEIMVLLEKMGVKKDSSSIRTAMRRITRSGDDVVSFEAFKKWYIASEARIEVQIHNVFVDLDKDASGYIEREEIGSLLIKMGHKPTEEEIDHVLHELQQAKKGVQKSHSLKDIHSPKESHHEPPKTEESRKSHDSSQSHGGDETPKEAEESPDKITLEQFEEWYMKSLFFAKHAKKHELEADADENAAISLDAPEDASKSAMAWYIFTYPLVAAMYCTLPDVRHEKFQRNWKMAVLEFVLCLAWIGVFCTVLYDCIVVISNTVGIPVPVAAVTLLAGGTSVPDLLSSYIVARKGEGDMAVSSSIGSNIFDVTVGLPLPWLAFCFAKMARGADEPYVKVSGGTIGFSLLVLIVMLVLVIGTIMACKWKLSKPLGITMLVFYVLFLVQYLLQEMPAWPKDPVFKTPF